MKKNFITIFLTLALFSVEAQVTQLNSGYNKWLLYTSVIKDNILISGVTDNFLVKSYDECKQLINLPCPGPSINYNMVQRLDTSNLFLFSFGNGTAVYKSVDGGNNWANKLTTTDIIAGGIFFDTLEGIMAKSLSDQLMRTYDGGSTWTTTTCPINNATAIEGYGDSTVLMGGSNGAFFITKDRGHTWQYCWGFSYLPIRFSFLNTDTMAGLSARNNWGETYFSITTNGSTWQNSLTPIPYCGGIYVRNAKELYIIGKDFNSNAVIAKSSDLGKTWGFFNTGVNGELTHMNFLNDSVALLTGQAGLLLRWNFKKTIFTGIIENGKEQNDIKIIPNPVQGNLKLEFQNNFRENFDLAIYNVLGQKVYSEENINYEKFLNVEFLIPDVYYLTIQSRSSTRVFKFVKE